MRVVEDMSNLASTIKTKEAFIASDEFRGLPEEIQGMLELEMIGLRARIAQASVEAGKVSTVVISH